MKKELLKKLARTQKIKDLSQEAVFEAFANGRCYTPWPLEPWILKTIKRRFEELGVRTRTLPLPEEEYGVKLN